MTTRLDRNDLEACCREIPLFPLPDLVFLPHSLLPLHVFEPRYRALIEDVLGTAGIIAVPRLGPGWDSDYGGSPALVPVCGFGRIIRHQALGDGRCNIILRGLGRMRLEGDHRHDRGYRIGHGRLLPDGGDSNGGAGLYKRHEALELIVMQVLGRKPEWKEVMQPLVQETDDPIEFMNKLAHLLLRCPDERQAYLELDDGVARNEFLLAAVVELQTLDPEVGA